MSSQDEYDYVDAAEFDDGNDYGDDYGDDYSDALTDDYQETEYDDLALHASGENAPEQGKPFAEIGVRILQISAPLPFDLAPFCREAAVLGDCMFSVYIWAHPIVGTYLKE